MCLRPKAIVNRHYLKLCDGDHNASFDRYGYKHDFFVKVDCGLCVECLRKYQSTWSRRLIDEYTYYCKSHPKSTVGFCLLTIAPKYYDDFMKSPNAFVRRFLERYRKRYGCSFKHWITSEYGEKRGRLHFHMISFGMLCGVSDLEKLWSYGWCSVSSLRGPQGITYVSKYVTKFVDKFGSLFLDPDKKSYRWISPGIGKSYSLDYDNRYAHFHRGDPVFMRFNDNGSPAVLPRYYYDKLFSPIDLCRRREAFFDSLLDLPMPPYRVNKHYYNDLLSYFIKLRELGGYPLFLSTQFTKLNLQEKYHYFYG